MGFPSFLSVHQNSVENMMLQIGNKYYLSILAYISINLVSLKLIQLFKGLRIGIAARYNNSTANKKQLSQTKDEKRLLTERSIKNILMEATLPIYSLVSYFVHQNTTFLQHNVHH